MKHFQLITLLLASFLTHNFVYASSDHDHETEKYHENKQDEDKKSRKNNGKNQHEQDDHSDKHDQNDEHNHKH